MSRRDYTAEDFGACRFILENASNNLTAQIDETVGTGNALTTTAVKRLRLLRLADGPVEVASDGEYVRLSGLGVKTAEEAKRLGKAAMKVDTVTFTNATNLVNATAHGFSNGERVRFVTSGTLPAELSAATTYYVINANANDFQVSLTSGGAAVTFTDDGTGTHDAHLVL